MARTWKHILSIATKMVSAPPVPGILQGGQQVSSTILMFTEKRGRGTILVAIESISSRSFPREIPVHGRFFERHFQPLSVGEFFSNQRESISWCRKSPFLSKTQNRQIARTSPSGDAGQVTSKKKESEYPSNNTRTIDFRNRFEPLELFFSSGLSRTEDLRGSWTRFRKSIVLGLLEAFTVRVTFHSANPWTWSSSKPTC